MNQRSIDFFEPGQEPGVPLETSTAIKNVHIGTDFADYLQKGGRSERLETIGLKMSIVQAIEDERSRNGLSKKKLASLVGTSRSQIDRILNPYDVDISISTVERVLDVVGLKIDVVKK